MPNHENLLKVYPYQSLMFNPTAVAARPTLTDEQGIFEHDQCVEILHRTIEHLKGKGKTVFVIGHSYGAAICREYLQDKPLLADRVVLMGYELDEDMRSFQNTERGQFIRWEDGEKPFVKSFFEGIPNDFPNKDRYDDIIDNLNAILKPHAEKRFTQLLKDKDLSKVILIHARFDEANGRISESDLEFLNKKNVPTIETFGDHHSMMTNACMGNLYAHLAEGAILKKSFAASLSYAIEKNGIENALSQVEKFNDESQYFPINENEMNVLGYYLIKKEKLAAAIEVFKLNVAAFPNSWNAYDSLGEAYMNNGDKELAIKNYEKSLELNPENSYGLEALEQLKND